MVEGKRKDAWDHTSSLLAAIENLLKGEDDELTQPSDLNPFSLQVPAGGTRSRGEPLGDRVQLTPETMDLMRKAWGC